MSECVICHKPLLPGQQAAHQIVGYEYPRTQGGTNVVHLRQRTGNVAHRECVEMSKLRGQESLL